MTSGTRTEQEEAYRSLALADSVAYYAHRRYRELRTEEALADYQRALRACEEALRRLQEAEAWHSESGGLA